MWLAFQCQADSFSWFLMVFCFQLLYFKITGILFPTSDFWHPVVTPAVTLMSQLLTKVRDEICNGDIPLYLQVLVVCYVITIVPYCFQCPVTSLEDVAAGLFIGSMFLEYVSLSKRLIPELINLLLGILHLATPHKASVGTYSSYEYSLCFSSSLFSRYLLAVNEWEHFSFPSQAANLYIDSPARCF